MYRIWQGVYIIKFKNKCFMHIEHMENKKTDRNATECVFSHTRSGFPFFLPMWDISISYSRTSQWQWYKSEQHASHTSFRHIITILKRRHHIGSQRFQDFMEALFMAFFQYKCGIKWWARKRIHYSCEGSVPRNHRLSSLGKPRAAIGCAVAQW